MMIYDLRKIIPDIQEENYKTPRLRITPLQDILSHKADEKGVIFLINDHSCTHLVEHQVLAMSYYYKKTRKIMVIDLSRVFSGKNGQDKAIVTYFNDWCLWSDYTSLVNADGKGVANRFAEVRGNIFALLLLAFKKMLGHESFFNEFKSQDIASFSHLCDFFISHTDGFAQQMFQCLQGSLTEASTLSLENRESFESLVSSFEELKWQSLLESGLDFVVGHAAAKHAHAGEDHSDKDESEKQSSDAEEPPKQTRRKRGAVPEPKESLVKRRGLQKKSKKHEASSDGEEEVEAVPGRARKAAAKKFRRGNKSSHAAAAEPVQSDGSLNEEDEVLAESRHKKPAAKEKKRKQSRRDSEESAADELGMLVSPQRMDVDSAPEINKYQSKPHGPLVDYSSGDDELEGAGYMSGDNGFSPPASPSLLNDKPFTDGSFGSDARGVNLSGQPEKHASSPIPRQDSPSLLDDDPVPSGSVDSYAQGVGLSRQPDGNSPSNEPFLQNTPITWLEPIHQAMQTESADLSDFGAQTDLTGLVSQSMQASPVDVSVQTDPWVQAEAAALSQQPAQPMQTDLSPSQANQSLPAAAEQDVFATVGTKVDFEKLVYHGSRESFPNIDRCFQHLRKDQGKIKFMLIQDGDGMHLPRSGILVISLYNTKGVRTLRVIDLTGSVCKNIFTITDLSYQADYNRKIGSKEIIFFKEWCINPNSGYHESNSILSQRVFVFLMIGLNLILRRDQERRIQDLIACDSLDEMVGHILSFIDAGINLIIFHVLSDFKDSLTAANAARIMSDERYLKSLRKRFDSMSHADPFLEKSFPTDKLSAAGTQLASNPTTPVGGGRKGGESQDRHAAQSASTKTVLLPPKPIGFRSRKPTQPAESALSVSKPVSKQNVPSDTYVAVASAPLAVSEEKPISSSWEITPLACSGDPSGSVIPILPKIFNTATGKEIIPASQVIASFSVPMAATHQVPSMSETIKSGGQSEPVQQSESSLSSGRTALSVADYQQRKAAKVAAELSKKVESDHDFDMSDDSEDGCERDRKRSASAGLEEGCGLKAPEIDTESGVQLPRGGLTQRGISSRGRRIPRRVYGNVGSRPQVLAAPVSQSPTVSVQQQDVAEERLGRTASSSTAQISASLKCIPEVEKPLSPSKRPKVSDEGSAATPASLPVLFEPPKELAVASVTVLPAQQGDDSWMLLQGGNSVENAEVLQGALLK